MTDTKPGTRSSLGKKLLIALAVVVLLLVVLYFVVTSAAFFKGIILPRAGKAMNAEITVADATISPFSKVVLHQLKIQPKADGPFIQAKEVVARYSLISIIKGNIEVDELTIDSPIIKVVENPGVKRIKTEKKTKPSKKTQPPRLDIKNVSLKNATFQQIKNLSDGTKEIIEISHFNLNLDQLKNGQAGKLEVTSDIRLENAAKNQPSILQAGLAGKFNFTLAENLLPKNAQGNATIAVKNATGNYGEFAGLQIALNCDLSPTEIKQLALQFLQKGKSLGEMRVAGPFDAAKKEGRLKIEVISIDRQVLNLFGASKGIDFGATKINSSSELELSRNGQLMALNGGVNIDSFSITKTNQTTPKLDLKVGYDLSVDQTTKSALIKTFTLDGTQNKIALLQGALAKPMKLDWSQGNKAPDDSAFDLTVSNLNLADWRAFTGEAIQSGKVGLKMNLLSQQAGKKLQLNLQSHIADFTAVFASNKIEHAEVLLTTRGEMNDFDQINLAECSLKLSQQNQPALTMSGSGKYSVKSSDADLQLVLDAMLPKLFALLNRPQLNASGGALKFSGQVTQKNKTQTVTGNFAIANFTGQSGNSRFENFSSAMDADIEKKEETIQIKRLAGNLKQGEEAGGSFDVSGNYNLEKKSGLLDLKLKELNQNAARPFLSGMLGDKKLVSISINGNASAKLDSAASSQVKGDFKIANLVVKDPAKAEPDAPLSAQLQMDAAMQKQILDLRQLQLILSPTARAKNQLLVKGQIDLSQTNAAQGKISLTSESLDITPFYNLYSAKNKKSGTPAASAPSSAPNSTSANQEPAPIKLPVKEFNLDLNIAQLYLREIAITKLQAAGKVIGSKISLNPMQMAMNGAPVKASVDLDLGVRGYIYAISFSADKIPLEPIANSFIPDKRGQYKGLILGQAQIKGAGMTGVNLRKSLNGRMSFSFTNANIQIAGPKLKKILVPIGIALRIKDITETPLNFIDSQIQLGGGNINVQKCFVESEAFQGTTGGVIPIADILTNSPLQKLPVNFNLRRSLAQKANLIPADAAPDAKYVKLPNFVNLTGTIGDPQTDINEMALGGLLLRSGSGIIGGKTGNILQEIGSVLSGQKSASTTNNPSANTNAPNANTNASSATTNPPPANSKTPSVNQLLDLFKKPKK
ncbi:MAG: hypothetical protein M3Y82_07325 [Verrucomicrobiota bacterium]|nr:hypothetical protein [Verrucomicrobiota bacterium]